MLKSCLNIQFNYAVSEMFDSIKITITKTLRIQKKEDKKKRRTCFIQQLLKFDASFKENVLKHKKDVGLKDVSLTQRNVFIINVC